MNAQYTSGKREQWTGLSEEEARKMTADRAMNPDVEYVEMMNGDIKEVPARNRHERRRDAKLKRTKKG